MTAGTIYAVVELPADVETPLVHVDGSAVIVADGEAITGEIFPVGRGGRAAVACKIDEAAAPIGLVSKARFQRLKARAFGEADDNSGLFVITGMEVFNAAWGTCVWTQDADIEDPNERQWRARAQIAASRQALGHLNTLPPAARSPGAGRPLVLDMTGEITAGLSDRLVPAIKAAHDSTIVVNIDSDGGLVAEGTPICRALQQHPHSVETNVVGKAHSMAAIMALHGDHRSIAYDGSIMVHAPHVSQVASLTARSLRGIANSLDRSAEHFAAILAQQTGTHLDMARQWVADETTFNAGDAYRAGLVHAIDHDLAPRQPSVIRARFRPVQAPFTALRPGRR